MTRPDNRYLGLAARLFAKELLWRVTCWHDQGDRPNVLLFATRRGGSTFAMEVIGANRGIRTLDQPLELLGPKLTAAQAADVPRYRQGQMTSLDDWTEKRLRGIVEAFLSGRAVANAPTRIWRSDTSFRSDRLVLKILDAKPLIGWFDDNFDCQLVYLTRHPIPQAMSCIRNRWSLTLDAYLLDRRFVEAYLDDGILSVAYDVVRGGSDLQRFILNWMFENVVPLRLLQHRPEWIHIRHEDCLAKPLDVIDQLADRLDLEDVDRMRSVIRRPSVSSRLSTEATRRSIEDGKTKSIVDSWRQHVDPDDERWTLRLFETFGLDASAVVH